MPGTIRKTLAVAALLSIAIVNGFHVVALQGLAYARMFSEYQQTMSVEDAFSLTFSGREVCGICVAVDNIRSGMDAALSDFANTANQPIECNLSICRPAAIPPEPMIEYGIPPNSERDGLPRETVSPPPRSSVIA